MWCDSPVVQGAGPQQQPTTERDPFVFSGLGKASGEVEGEDDEERDVPGMKPREMINEFWVKKIRVSWQNFKHKNISTNAEGRIKVSSS